MWVYPNRQMLIVHLSNTKTTWRNNPKWDTICHSSSSSSHHSIDPMSMAATPTHKVTSTNNQWPPVAHLKSLMLFCSKTSIWISRTRSSCRRWTRVSWITELEELRPLRWIWTTSRDKRSSKSLRSNSSHTTIVRFNKLKQFLHQLKFWTSTIRTLYIPAQQSKRTRSLSKLRRVHDRRISLIWKKSIKLKTIIRTMAITKRDKPISQRQLDSNLNSMRSMWTVMRPNLTQGAPLARNSRRGPQIRTISTSRRKGAHTTMMAYPCMIIMGLDQVHIRRVAQEEAREINIREIIVITVASPMTSGCIKSSMKWKMQMKIQRKSLLSLTETSTSWLPRRLAQDSYKIIYKSQSNHW